MALDGLVIAAIKSELEDKIMNGRIVKIYEPEHDEIILNIKNNGVNYKLLLSANASLPLIYLSTESTTNPMTAPNFCMLLRKHINGGRIVSIEQPNYERILNINIEHLNEMGDLCQKTLIIEIMGKHSNIIFCDDEKNIIDSIKRISIQVSSVREVLPGRTYVLPPSQDKLDPLTLNKEEFISVVYTKEMPVFKAIYTSITGFSPLVANELCIRANIDQDKIASTLTENEKLHLYNMITILTDEIKNNHFVPVIAYDGEEPIEFSATNLTCFPHATVKKFDSISEVLELFFAQKNTVTRMKQRSTDLRKIIQNAIERTSKKYELQKKQLEDTKSREKYKIYGELINTYGYNVEEGAKKLECVNYYTNEEITIPLDPLLSPKANAQRYFEKYNKQKRTYEALTDFLLSTKEDLDHLETISIALDMAMNEDDLAQVREELIESGYMKRKFSKGKKKKQPVGKPLNFLSSDGFEMFVGKNNYQNEELTFNVATGNDWWFHAKGMAGSHVIVKANNQDLPDTTFEQAASLAAYYSKAKTNEKVEIDYTQKKNIKKPPASKPGFVIYNTYFSMVATPKEKI